MNYLLLIVIIVDKSLPVVGHCASFASRPGIGIMPGKYPNIPNSPFLHDEEM